MNDESLKLAAWSEATVAYGYDSDLWRYDQAGLPMYWEHYQDTQSIYGWDISISPSTGGNPDRFIAVHWQTNVELPTQRPQPVCPPGTRVSAPFTLPSIPAYVW